jgi:hypothetical protein
VKIRISGTPDEVEATVAELRRVLDVGDVREYATHRPGEIRAYLEAALRPADPHAIKLADH